MRKIKIRIKIVTNQTNPNKILCYYNNVISE